MTDKELFEKLSYSPVHANENITDTLLKDSFDYAEGYKSFLDKAKTERESVLEAVRLAEENGFEYIDEKLHDIGGIRITCKYLDDVYKVRDLIMSRKDIILKEERDYIKKPKPSGYRSLHLIVLYHVETINGQIPVLLEFQIRTHAMHFWASIEHSLKYKFKKQVPQSLKERLITASFAARTLDMEMSQIHDELVQLENENDSLLGNDPMENEIQINNAKRW